MPTRLITKKTYTCPNCGSEHMTVCANKHPAATHLIDCSVCNRRFTVEDLEERIRLAKENT